MQYTMDNDAMQLTLITSAKGLSILFYAVDTDAEFARKYRLAFRQREGHNVCIEIMAKTLFINFKQFLIAAKIVVQLPYRLAMLFDNLTNPSLDALWVNGRHLHIQSAESYHLNVCFSSSNTR
jgi:hypothetical protein